MDLKIVVNGKEFVAGYRFGKALAQIIASSDGNDYLLALALAKGGLPEIAIPFIEADKLLPKDYLELWEMGERSIRLALLENTAFMESAPDTVIRDVLASGDESMLLELTRNVKSLDGIWQTFEGIEGLSDRGWRLLRFLRHHPLKSIRSAYAKLGWLPHGLDMDFAEARKAGVPLGDFPPENLDARDISLINLNDRAECSLLASNIGRIKNPEAVRVAALKLARHPDPQIRSGLAGNLKTPDYILPIIYNDKNEDSDIRITASRTLFKKRKKSLIKAQNLKR